MTKSKKIALFSSLGIVTIAAVVVPSILLISDNSKIPNNSVIETKYIQPKIDQDLNGMTYDPKKYDELVDRKLKYTSYEKYGDLYFENESLVISFDKEIFDKKIYIDMGGKDFANEIAKQIFATLNTASIEEILNLEGSKKIIHFKWRDDNKMQTSGEVSDSDSMKIYMGTIVGHENWARALNYFNVFNEKRQRIIEAILDVVVHEYNHTITQYAAHLSSAQWNTIFRKNPMNDDAKRKFKLMNLFNFFKALGKENDFNIFFNDYIKLNFDSFVSKYSTQLPRLEYFDNVYSYVHDITNVKNYQWKIWDISNNSSSLFEYSAYSDAKEDMQMDELVTRLLVHYIIHIDPNAAFFPDAADAGTTFMSSLGAQLYSASYINLDMYPKDDLEFSARFMKEYYKWFYGIGRMNTLQIDRGVSTDTLTFNASDTELQKYVSKIKVSWEDEDIEFDVVHKEYPIGWDYRMLTKDNQRYYKYISHSAFGVAKLKIKHIIQPKEIIMYDKDGNVLKSTNTEFIFNNEMDNRFDTQPLYKWMGTFNRFTYNDQTSTWDENYDIYT